jgi:hypothetical protein
VLLCERARESDSADETTVDKDLAEKATGSPLLVECLLDVPRRHQAFVDEQHAERSPGKLRLIHGSLIGCWWQKVDLGQ